MAGSVLTTVVAIMRVAAPAAAADEERAMLLKYTARCALAEGQFLEAAEFHPARRFPGALGLAPEWLQGTCGPACQEKVSSCLIALTNRTGRHVALSLLSGAPGLGAAFRASDDDVAFPHQEGAFFGNVFSGRPSPAGGATRRRRPR